MQFTSTLAILGAVFLAAVGANPVLIRDAPTATSSIGPWSMLLNMLVQKNSAQTSMSSKEYSWLSMNATTAVVPGGPNVTFYGDTKSINAQILKMNPKYNPEDFVSSMATVATNPHTNYPSTAELPPLCNNWPQAGSINNLEEAIVDLNSSVLYVDVPKGSCMALSCIDGDSIGLCNDNEGPILKMTRNLIPYLEILINSCLSATGTVNAQVFDTGDFNLIYNKGSCVPSLVAGDNYQANHAPSAGPTMGGSASGPVMGDVTDDGVQGTDGVPPGSTTDPSYHVGGLSMSGHGDSGGDGYVGTNTTSNSTSSICTSAECDVGGSASSDGSAICTSGECSVGGSASSDGSGISTSAEGSVGGSASSDGSGICTSGECDVGGSANSSGSGVQGTDGVPPGSSTDPSYHVGGLSMSGAGDSGGDGYTGNSGSSSSSDPYAGQSTSAEGRSIQA